MEVYRILKKNGFLTVKLPNYSNLFNKIKFLKNGIPDRMGGTINNGDHINFIPYKYLINFVKDYFEVVEIKGDIFRYYIYKNVMIYLKKR